MLMKFMHSGGQKAFFDTFYWAISNGSTVAKENGIENTDLPEDTGEFLPDDFIPKAWANFRINRKEVINAIESTPGWIK